MPSRTGRGGGDDHEDLDVIEVGLDEARRMASGGEIVDAKTVLLIEALHRSSPPHPVGASGEGGVSL